eukprot:CAMPEP_0115272760 /NCGR_PEP_ID=MMETSP0270-20121206/54794_1 /TAXON_ID=71861 /ORGANISM="Scrippsiella trochoidea, Strain CCMP3099" /LENGTH=53 /DNA_ID=CAMNT_0002689187 /DNA_START=165 /DNA_END=326 /DNA_ORIENTATION=+
MNMAEMKDFTVSALIMSASERLGASLVDDESISWRPGALITQPTVKAGSNTSK